MLRLRSMRDAIGCVGRTARRLAIAAVAGVVLSATPAHALDQSLTIAQFYHTAWTVKEGAPGEVTALAQTGDGYLWIGTQVGLFRFDGMRFARYVAPGGQAFPSQSVSALYAPPSGGLWIGYRYGNATFLGGDRLTNYTALDGGFSTGSVFGFASGPDGVVWAATFRGLQRLSGGRWEWIRDDWRFPGAQARDVFVDRDGTVWAASEDRVAYLPRGARAFETVAGRAELVSTIAQASDGTVWVAESAGGLRRIERRAGKVELAEVTHAIAASDVLFDRDDGLWIASAGQGVRRVLSAAAAPVQTFDERDGLSGDYSGSLLEDREGSLWIGTSRGLDRLRRANLVPAALPNGAHDFALAATATGDVWVGTRNRPLLRFAPDGRTTTGIDRAVTCAYRDPDGVLWFGGPDGIWRLDGDDVVRVAALPDEAKASSVQAITRDADGALWVSLNVPGVFLYSDGRWTHWREQAELLTRASPLTLATDAGEAVWLGFSHNRIVRFDGAVSRLFDDKDGLDVGNVTVLRQGAARLWVAGAQGLGYFDGERFRTLVADRGTPFDGATGLVERANGDLWINAASGVVHVRADELRRRLDDASYRVAYETFGVLDGAPGAPPQFRPLPSAVEAADGRLWFATTGGVVWLNPDNIVRNPLPPPVLVQSLRVADVDYSLADVPHLPPHAPQLRIGYTATSLTIPERVRFRYRLEGQDAQWQDAGDRREASYTNLRPGAYRFRVTAANDAGVWNPDGAAIDFVVEPAFFETWWFRVSCAVVAAVLLWALYLWRLRLVAERLRARLEERQLERERIARDLHDTLLQSVQGLLLKFHAAIRSMPDDGAKEKLARALDRAEDVVAEGRDRVKDLRTSAPLDLAHALSDVGAELAHDRRYRFVVTVVGAVRAIDPLVAEDAFFIAREALVNASMHAHAEAIEVEIDHTNGLRIVVRDDGVGIDAAVLDAGGKPGHWGIPGMRERAARIGATLSVRRRDGSGTDVELRVPIGSTRGRAAP